DGRHSVHMESGIYNFNTNQTEFGEGSVVSLPILPNPMPSVEVPYDDSQSFRITVDEFYLIDTIKVIDPFSGQELENIEVTNLYSMDITLANITEDKILRATFIDGRSEVYTSVGSGAVEPDNQGSISPNDITLVPHEGSHSYIVEPDPGYKIKSISITKDQDESVEELIITDPFYMEGEILEITDSVHINSTFEEYRPSIYSIANGQVDPITGEILPAQGTISPDGEHDFIYGSDQAYTITPNSGYKISEVKVDGISQSILDVYSMVYTFANLEGDHTIEITFAELPYEVNVAVIGQGSVNPNFKKVDSGDDLEITLTAGEGQVVDKVSINGKISQISGEQSEYGLQLTDIDGNMDITAFFRKASVIEQGLGYANSGTWTTIETSGTYNSMVVVTTPVITANDPSLCIRVANVLGNSFDVLVSRLDGNAEVISGIPFTYFIVEEGVYTEENDGIAMEAVKYESIKTDRKGSWKGEQRSYQNTYSSPVVIGQVMSANDSEWSVFWSRGNKNQNIPNASNLYVGKHVGEDPNNSRLDETVGYIVFETGSFVFNNSVLQTEVGIDKVDGVQNNGYTYTNLPEADFVVASQSAMDGGDGGFAVLYGDHAPSNGNLTFAINEDRLKDSERSHTTEQVAWLALRSLTETTAVTDSFQINELIANGNVVINDFLNDEITISLKTDVADGTLLLDPNGDFQFVSNSGNADSFEYEILNSTGEVLSTGSVNLNP
ncbi:MAG: hypothetical protein NE328_24960, partial [Lentisphaeraceae bacterium]|nr:hypothetical protein [Lentisphaeraceae bacterium]